MESLFALQTGASLWMNNTKLCEGVSYFDFFPVGETSGLDFRGWRFFHRSAGACPLRALDDADYGEGQALALR